MRWDISDGVSGGGREIEPDVLGTIDKYELLKELGTGGFGSVYLARDKAERRLVAVKGLPREMKDSAEELERIRRNFELIVQLKHDNIVALRQLHQANSIAYRDEETAKKLNVERGQTLLVMDYAEGVPLSRWALQFPDGKVPVGKAIEVTRQIATALDYAHSHKIIHRDVKPQNVVMQTREDGTFVAQVLDFGLAAEVRSSMNRSSAGNRGKSGTRLYMPPEQWHGKEQKASADQYSLAVLFYELLLGKVPFQSAFDSGDPVVAMTAVTTQPPEIPEDLPKSVRRALVVALAKSGDERFASCADFVAALEGRKVAKPGGTRSVAPALVGIAAALALAAGGAWWWQGGKATGTSGTSGTGGTDTVALTEYKGSKPGGTKTITLPGGAKMEMVWCPAGSFMMGSPLTEDSRSSDETQHRVTLTQGFWMGKYEVTQRQWESVMGDNPSRFKSPTRPVEQVSWDDCQDFIRKINAAGKVMFSLPTEAQWEYACRAGTTTPFNFGSVLNGDKANCNGNYPYGTSTKGRYREETSDVGSYTPNDWGLYDMHGNVWEWCSDWYGEYTGNATDPTGPASGSHRVCRGGSWVDDARYCRSANRDRSEPGYRFNCLGLRLVCSAGQRR